MNLSQRLLKSVQAGPDRTAIVDGDRVLTYGEFAALAVGCASLVPGWTKKPRVGIVLPPSLSFAVAYFGVVHAAHTAVPINFLLSAGELDHIIADADLDAVVTTARLAEPFKGKVAPLILIEDEMRNIRAAAASAKPADLAPSPARDDTPATILYTSGTAAVPKGVILTHGNLVSDCDSCIEALSLDSSHVLLAMLPFFHSFGLTTGLLLPLAFGGKTVMLARFNVPELLDLVEKHRVSIILTIPSIWNAMLRTDLAVKRDLSSLRIAVSGGEPLPTQTYDRFLERFGFPLSEGYGLTETSPVVSIVPMGDRRRGSAGLALPRVHILIRDDQGRDLPPGVEGEICIRGPNVCAGYLNLPGDTAAAIAPDGCLRTGDLGSLDKDGFLYITGRKKDLIISAGENISPREIEETILLHPSVAEAAVVGVPDKMRGEVVKAFIIAKPGTPPVDEAALRDFCTGRLAPFKVPRFVEFVADLPRGFTGKVLKRKLVR